MASSFVNQRPPPVPETSSGAAMASFSGGSPSVYQLGGHEFTSPFAGFELGDIPTNTASHSQYQWPPLFASPSNSFFNSHVPQASGPPHIRLMYPSVATLEEQIVPPVMAIPPMRPPPPPHNEDPSSPLKPAARCRKRIHSCSMCEKAFDRPSTLKKVRPLSFLDFMVHYSVESL